MLRADVTRRLETFMSVMIKVSALSRVPVRVCLFLCDVCAYERVRLCWGECVFVVRLRRAFASCVCVVLDGLIIQLLHFQTLSFQLGPRLSSRSVDPQRLLPFHDGAPDGIGNPYSILAVPTQDERSGRRGRRASGG